MALVELPAEVGDSARTLTSAEERDLVAIGVAAHHERPQRLAEHAYRWSPCTANLAFGILRPVPGQSYPLVWTELEGPHMHRHRPKVADGNRAGNALGLTEHDAAATFQAA